MRCGGIYNDGFIANFLESIAVKHFLKLVNIWRRCGQLQTDVVVSTLWGLNSPLIPWLRLSPFRLSPLIQLCTRPTARLWQSEQVGRRLLLEKNEIQVNSNEAVIMSATWRTAALRLTTCRSLNRSEYHCNVGSQCTTYVYKHKRISMKQAYHAPELQLKINDFWEWKTEYQSTNWTLRYLI